MTTDLLNLNHADLSTDAPELPELTREDAVKVTEDLRQQLNTTYTAVVYAYQHRVWVTLGYDSWEKYLEAEIGEPQLLHIHTKDRVETIGAMVNAQMSSRAISAATGISKSTVNRTAQQAREQGLVAEDAQVMSRNGKQVKATKERSIAEEIPQDLLDAPADSLGIKTFEPKKSVKDKPSQAKTPPKKTSEEHSEPGQNPGLVEVSEAAEEFEELARQVIDDNGRQRFDPEVVTDQLVQHVTRTVLTGAAMLELFNLQEDLLGESETTTQTLEAAVGTLDRVLDALGR